MLFGYTVDLDFSLAQCNPKPGFHITEIRHLINDGGRPNYVNNGAVFKGAAPFTPNIKSQRNCVAAFFKRSAMTHAINMPLRFEFEAFVHNEFIPNYLYPNSNPWRMLTDDEAIDRMPFTVRVKTKFKEMLRTGRSAYPEFIAALKRLIAFIKLEFYMQKKFPRFIMPRSEFFRIWHAILTEAINHCIYGWDCGIKKTPFSERGAVLRALFGDGPVFEIDCTAFESSTDSWLMNHIQRPIYHAFAQGGDMGLIDPFIDAKSETQVFDVCGMRMEGPATLTSGEPDTSHWNFIINFLVLSFASFRATGEYPVAKIEGDDGVFKPIPHVEQVFNGIGFTAKLEYHDSIVDAGFCRVYCGGRANLTDALFSIVKLGWSDASYLAANKTKKLGLLKAKCMSYLVQYSGCPIIGPVVDRILERIDHVEAIAPRDWWERQKYDQWKPELRNRQPMHCDRVEYQRLFDITVLDQVTIEAELLQSINHWDLSQETYLESPTALAIINEKYPDWKTVWMEDVCKVNITGKIASEGWRSEWPSDSNDWTSLIEENY